jgi:Flp pilus assembly protein TadD
LLLVTGALLVAFFTPLIGAWRALFAATLFCVHTANTETMNLISARSELLSAIGLLGSFVVWQRSPFARRTGLYLLPLAIGALAKAPVVVFAPLLFFYVRIFEDARSAGRSRAWREAFPPLLLGIVLLAFLNSMNAPEWTSGGGSAYHYVITQPFVWLHYFRLFVLPVGLTADTDWTTFAHWYDTRAVAGFAFVALLVWVARRAFAPMKFGLAWFVIALIPTSLFPLAEVANEHRIFFAYVGLVLALASLLPERVLAPVAVVLLLAHALGTHERNEVWKTGETLWADVVAKSPANGRAWMNYGLAQMARGRYAVAKSHFERAASLVPNYSTLEINRGIVEGQLGDHAAAERHFRRAVSLSPDSRAHYFFARWLAQRGRIAEALPHVRTAVQLSPSYSDARELLARLERTWPNYQEAFTAGLDAIRRRDWTAAVQANREALRHDPRSADAYNNLGWSLAQLGLRDRARRAYEQAIALRPDDERVRNNLALLQ